MLLLIKSATLSTANWKLKRPLFLVARLFQVDNKGTVDSRLDEQHDQPNYGPQFLWPFSPNFRYEINVADE
jgi:hypothetical protein